LELAVINLMVAGITSDVDESIRKADELVEKRANGDSLILLISMLKQPGKTGIRSWYLDG